MTVTKSDYVDPLKVTIELPPHGPAQLPRRRASEKTMEGANAPR